MEQFLLLLFFVNCSVAYVSLGKYSPISLLNYVWFFMLSLFYFLRDNFKLESFDFLWLFYLSCTTALLAALSIKLIFSYSSPIKFNNNNHKLELSKNILILYTLFPFFALIYCYYTLSFQFDMAYLAELRVALTENDGVLFGSLGRIGQIAIVMSFIILVSGARLGYKIFSVSCAFLVNFPLLAKESYVLFFFSLIYISLLTRKQSFTNVTFKIFIPCILFLFSMMWVRYSEHMSIEFFDMIFNTYLLSGIPAFGMFQHDGEVNWDFSSTLRSLYLIFNKYGTNFDVSPILYDFVATPYVTNVYTFIRPYYSDFGVFGVFLYSFFIGIFLTTVYEFAIRKGGGALVFLSLFAYPICFSFFAERFYNWTTQWIIFYAVIYLSVVKVNYSRGNKNVH